MAEVFSNSPCTMLGKRVLSPSHHHSSGGSGSLVGGSGSSPDQPDFSLASAKKRQRFEGAFDRHETVGGGSIDHPNANARSLSPARPGKRARPLSCLQSSSSLLRVEGNISSTTGAQGVLGFSQHFKNGDASSSSSSWRDRNTEELTALRREVGVLREQAVEKESGLTLAREENARLCDGLSRYQKEVERLTSENRILKRAVGIQNTKGKELESQLHDLQQTAGQAAEYIKRLEQTNYALTVRLQAMGNSGPNDFMGGHRPPDVY